MHIIEESYLQTFSHSLKNLIYRLFLTVSLHIIEESYLQTFSHSLLSYYGAVPKYLVPDNLKTAVTKHSKDELVLQSAFSDLETFYDTIILPPPPRKPKGKPTVENHVRFTARIIACSSCFVEFHIMKFDCSVVLKIKYMTLFQLSL